MRTSPLSLTPQRSEGPPQRYAKGAADRWGMAAAFSPRCPAAACGNRDKAPTTTTSVDTQCSIVGRKLSVRKRTFVARLYSSDRGAAVVATNSPNVSPTLSRYPGSSAETPLVLGARCAGISAC